ncbi:dihydrolipoamide acetyltransferase family protein [Noviherbaspirillum galbum]|uniref:Dihydrolipoamide acetyltransferase component of pyruvate dehydrogenase complex n=1 Tax=Noviherbaspirillum galbum TaxID=2709383 RepID=A0A6B3SSN4_9BURK|nr:dihydrolipoamide acetyltransferase family protein [Noviherbaspirillum galbum]NEX62365.1 2-oxo acid dehydrogenase subunit E2 [Noviherbaspirillum galbum]
MIEFKLPFLGADVDEGKLLQWQVKPGDAVKRGQVVAVVDTSKAAVDVESWQEGTVAELLAAPGDTLPVGAVLATLLEEGETMEMARRSGKTHEAGAVAPGTTASTAPDGARESQPGGVNVLPARPVPTTPYAGARRRTSPAARKYAEDHDIDIGAVAGTGPEGAVTLQDVQRAAALSAFSSAPSSASSPQPSPVLDRQAEMRRSIAAAMSRSKKEIPHYYLSEPVPMRRAQEWLLAANATRSLTSRILMATLQIKAVALALARYPELNGFYVDGGHRPSGAVHVGVAIALRQGGLVAPAIHDVASKPLDRLMEELTDLVKRTRAGSLRSSEMSDPTITVTNLGEQGVETVHGVIYPPQVALVGFGRIAQRPWARDDALCVMPVTTATLAADHRVSDGHYGALFLAELRDRLQQPEQL